MIYQCHPSYKTIGKALQMSTNTVRKYVDSLRKKRLIATEPTEIITKDNCKRNGSLLYTILPIDEAVQFYFDEQMKRNAEIIRQQKIERRLKELA